MLTQLLSSSLPHLALAAIVLLSLVAVNFGPSLWTRLRQPKPSGWLGSQPAPPGFTDYLAAVETACTGLDAKSLLVVLRGGLCPDAAAVVKVVKQG